MTVERGDCDRLDERPGNRPWRRILTSSVLYRRSPGGVRLLAAFVWLLFIVFPLINAVGKRGPVLGHGLVIGGAALFVVTYVTLVMRWHHPQDPRLPLLLFALLLGLAIALTISQASGWGFLFTYCAACVAVVAPEGQAFYGVALCSILAGVTSAAAGADGGAVLGFVASSAGIGLLVAVMADLRLRNQQLSEARAELARMAVAQERERFARDLHDLLGHSLSVIALKAELAGRMLGGRPREGDAAAPPLEDDVLDRAAVEVRELEQVARTALGEVREAVSGYRQPTLVGELAGARMALSAAGIEADIQQTHVPLDPPVEAVLAWTIREGATNVIRHSGARHCTLRITASLTDAAVEVIDDGVGAGPGSGVGAGLDSVQSRGTYSATRSGANCDAGGVSSVDSGGAPHRHMGAVSSVDSGGAPDRHMGAVSSVDSGGAPDRHTGAAAAADSGGAGMQADNGVGPRPRNGGHGLAGLAERARLLNGTIEAGALAGGGYRLAVTVPVSRT